MDCRPRAAEPRIAFVVDALLFQGGAEKVLAAAYETFPQADLFSLVYRPEPFRQAPFAGRRVTASFLDRLPGARAHHRWYFPLMPLAVQRFDLKRYDIVVSFSYAVAHGVRTHPGQRHLAYIHTPMRWAWRLDHPLVKTLERRLPPAAWGLRAFLGAFRGWDRAAATRPQELVTVSQWMAGCIRLAYGRQARVIYPPVETDFFRPLGRRQAFYVSLGRLVSHKRIDQVVEAFNRLGLPLLVIGEGPEEKRLQVMAGPNIRFLGWQPQACVAELLGQARAFVHAGEEDFGIAIAEAQAAGCPVVALGRGAAPEIVGDGQTGFLFAEPSPDSLAAAVVRMEREHAHFDPILIRASAARFDVRRFQREFYDLVMGKEEAQCFPHQEAVLLDKNHLIS